VPEDISAQAKQQIEQALVENVDGVVDALALLQALEERGALPLVRALLEQGDEVLKVLLALMGRDEVTGGLKNVIGVAQFFTSIPPEAMSRLFEAASGGIAEASNVSNDAKIGIYDALKALRDPDISRALSVALAFLKGMGKALGETASE
jgi:uncharacterized protein YjgD (DUF1641 family)